MATLTEIRLKDPLSDVTRKERRALLGAGAIGLVMVKAGLVLSKISALGIDLSPTDQKTLLRATAFVVGYFAISFLIYAASDFLAWRHAIRSAVREVVQKRYEQRSTRIQEREKHEIEQQVAEALQHRLGRWFDYWRFGVRPVSFARAVFEFVLPVLLGAYSMYCLLAR
jgi:hypothetical protein